MVEEGSPAGPAEHRAAARAVATVEAGDPVDLAEPVVQVGSADARAGPAVPVAVVAAPVLGADGPRSDVPAGVAGTSRSWSRPN